MMDKDFSPIILRNGTVFGLSPRMRFDLVVNIMTKYAVNENKIFIVGGGLNWRPIIHVDDVATAFILALEAPLEDVKGEIFNVGSNELNFQIKDIADKVKKIIPSTHVEYAPSDKDSRNYHV